MRWLTRILHALYRGILYLLTFYLVVVFAVMLVLHVPAIQQALVPYAEKGLSKALNTKVELGTIHLKLFDVVKITDFVMYDQHDAKMFAAKELCVGVMDITLLQWLKGNDEPKLIGARTVTLKKGLVNLYVAKQDSTLNLNFLTETEEEDTTAGPIIGFDFPELVVEDLNFNFVDSTLQDTALAVDSFQLNYSNLSFENIDLRTGFSLDKAGKLNVNLRHLQAKERKVGMNLRHLSVNLSAYMDSTVQIGTLPERTRGVLFKDLRLSLNRTNVNMDMNMRSEYISTLFSPGRNREFTLTARPSVIDPKLISLFVPMELPPLAMIGLEGGLAGDYMNIASKGLNIGYGEQTRLNIDELLATDYTDPDKLFARVNIDPSYVHMGDVQPFLSTDTLRQQIGRLDHLALEGRLTGSAEDLLANLKLSTGAGAMVTEIEIFNLNDLDAIKYQGKLAAIDVNLDTLIDGSISKSLTTTLEFVGQGIDPAKMQADFRLRIYPSDIAGYQIDSAKGDLAFKQGEILGEMTVTDTEGSFEGNIDVLLSDTLNKFMVFGDLDKLDLHHYGVTEDTLKLSTIVNLNFQGDSLDALTGYLRVFETNLYRYATATRVSDTLSIRQLKLKAANTSATEKNYTLTSSLLNVEVEGEFTYTAASKQVAQFAQEVQLYLQNDTAKIDSYYTKKVKLDQETEFTADFKIKDISPLTDFFDLDLHLAEGAMINTRFHFGENEDFAVRMLVDTLAVSGIELDSLRGRYELHKPGNRNIFLGDGDFHTAYIKVAEGVSFTKLDLVPIFDGDEIDFTLHVEQQQFNNVIDFDGWVTFQDDGLIATRLDADKTQLILEGEPWRFSAGNRILVGPEVLLIEDMSLMYRDQSLGISANIHPDTALTKITSLKLDINDFQLSFIDNFLQDTLGLRGVMNADIEVEELFAQPLVFVDGTVNSFGVYGSEFGQLRLNSNWNNEEQRLNLTVSLLREEKTLLALTGLYDPVNPDNALDFKLTTNDLPLDIAQVFYDEYLYDVDGRLTIRQLTVQGSFADLRINGEIELDHIAFGVRDLGQRFYINDKIRIDRQNIYFEEVKLWDRVPTAKQESSAKGAHYVAINGTILHGGFTTFVFDLEALQPNQPELFVIDNNAVADESPFYGKVMFKRIFARVQGPADDMSISAQIDIADNSVINIPISSYTEEQRLDYVYFGEPGDTALTNEIKENLSASGYDLDVTVDIGSGTEVRVIFDEKTGDVISAYGDGLMTVDVAANGDIQMFGNYQINRGDYLFTFQNVINKKFDIDPGSRISWDGDPYDAQLDIRAIYQRQVQLSSLDSTLSGTLPVNVVLKMEGSLTNTQIAFAIETAQASASGNYRLVSKLQSINADQQELNRQVFSLLLFQQFAPMGSFIGGQAAGGVSSSVSEFLSNQLNNLLSKTLRSDDIRVELQNRQDVVQVGLRVNLFDDRVTIERNGAIASGANQDLTIGNVQVRIQILPTRKNERRKQNTGVLELIIFNRENISTNQVVAFNRGVRIGYTKRFNTIADFFNFADKAEQRKSETNLRPSAPEVAPLDVEGRQDTSMLELKDTVSTEKDTSGADLDTTQVSDKAKTTEDQPAPTEHSEENPPEGKAPEPDSNARSPEDDEDGGE